MKPIHGLKGIDSNVAITYDLEKCIGCNACVRTCDMQAVHVYEKDEKPKFPPHVKAVKLEKSDCIGCGQCILSCPTSAITPHDEVLPVLEELRKTKEEGRKIMVAMLAPSTRVAIGEAYGQPIGVNRLHHLIRVLKEKCGFDYVFDVNYGADETSVIDTQEVLKSRAVGAGPVFTSCCPGWVNYVETFYPQLLPRVSTARSCVAMVASLVKNVWVKTLAKKPGHEKITSNDIYCVDIMPCTAKKMEAKRPQLHNDVDACITVSELPTLLEHYNVSAEDFNEELLTPEFISKWSMDEPFNLISGGSNIFGKTGGVAENVLRVIASLDGGRPQDLSETMLETFKAPGTCNGLDQTVRKITCTIGDGKYTAIVAHGGSAIHHVCEQLMDGKLSSGSPGDDTYVDVIEMMACPGGCLGGGGTLKVRGKKDQILARKSTLEALDNAASFKSAASNASLMAANGHLTADEAHHLLHTSFHNRRGSITASISARPTEKELEN